MSIEKEIAKILEEESKIDRADERLDKRKKRLNARKVKLAQRCDENKLYIVEGSCYKVSTNYVHSAFDGCNGYVTWKGDI